MLGIEHSHSLAGYGLIVEKEQECLAAIVISDYENEIVPF